MNFLKKILVTLVAAIITTTIVYGGYTIYAAEEYDFESTFTYITMELYHESMNELFNESLAGVVEILKNPDAGSDKGVNDPRLKSPCIASQFAEKDGTAKCEKKCRDNPENVSTYCVSVRATDMYLRYVAHLGSLQGSINFESLGWARMELTPATDLIYKQMLIRDEKINTDLERSRRVLEATLAAYNEFMTAYPIHKEYQVIIKNLIKYKNKLKDIRDYAIQFPTTFIDVTSTKCS